MRKGMKSMSSPSLTKEVGTASNIPSSPIVNTRAIFLGSEYLINLALELDVNFASATIASEATLLNYLNIYRQEKIIVIALQDSLDVVFLKWLDELCDTNQTCWVQFHLDQAMGWLGPLVVPSQTANYHDLLVRRLTMFETPDVYEALTALPIRLHSSPLPPKRELIWMLTIFLTEIKRWLTKETCHLLSTEVEANPLTLQLTHYPILPLPDHPLTSDLQISATKNAHLLLNDRCGVIVRTTQIFHHPSIPKDVRTIQAHGGMMRWHYPDWPASSIASGSTFGDETAAFYAAVGEIIERYCGNYMYDLQPIQASYNDLMARGEHAIDPQTLILYSQQMYQQPGCPFVPFSRDLPVRWVKGWSLTHNRAAWLPFSLVYIYTNLENTERFPNEPAISYTNYPGVAAGATIEQALVSAIEEVVERDSMMIWWLNRHPLPAIQLPPAMQALWQGQPTDMGQRAWLIYLQNEFDLPVIAGVLENSHEQLLSIGFACRHDPIQAALKAWTEAINLQEISRDLNDPNGALYSVVQEGLAHDIFKPWREDRMYVDDYQDNYQDVIHLLNQSQFFLDPRAIEQVRPWLDVPATRRFADIPNLPQRSLINYQKHIESCGYEIFYIDLTTPDIRHTGLKAVRVIIPGLVPNFPAAFPPLGGGRVQNIPVQLGWRANPLPADELNYMPMPYA